MQSRGGGVDDHTRLGWGGDGWTDPIFVAERDHDGGWDITRVERSHRESTHLAGDGELCDWLVDVARTHPYPFGSHVEPAWVHAVKPGVATVESWWTTHHRLSYLEHHRTDGALTGSDLS